ncbi:MAG: aminotransferase class IV, partial [Kiritimatiellae bacterium]|nr:aminotransferase class IV [Kiritimatiellia bacterium]
AHDFDTSAVEEPWKVTFAKEPIDVGDVFLYHKTTRRALYEQAKDAAPGFDDVLLWNAKSEVTESTIANIVVERDGKKVTPPVECGLLAGIFREYLLECGDIEESVITVDDIKSSDQIWLINSVRKWVPIKVL